MPKFDQEIYCFKKYGIKWNIENFRKPKSSNISKIVVSKNVY